MVRTLGNRHSVFPFDCSANCWGVGDVSVYLKADRSNYARSPFSIFRPPRCCMRISTGEVRYPVPHQSPARFFAAFRLTIVLEGNFQQLDAAGSRASATSPSSFHRKLQLSSAANPRETFPLPEQDSGRLVEGEKVEACFRDALSSNPASSTFISPASGGVSAGAA